MKSVLLINTSSEPAARLMQERAGDPAVGDHHTELSALLRG